MSVSITELQPFYGNNGNDSQIITFVENAFKSSDPLEHMLGYAAIVMVHLGEDCIELIEDTREKGSTFANLQKIADVMYSDVPGAEQKVHPLFCHSSGDVDGLKVYIARVSDLGYVCVASHGDNSIFCAMNMNLEIIFVSFINGDDDHYAFGGTNDEQIGDGYRANPRDFKPSDIKLCSQTALLNYMNAFGGAQTRDLYFKNQFRR